jgi:hypothetical protein
MQRNGSFWLVVSLTLWPASCVFVVYFLTRCGLARSPLKINYNFFLSMVQLLLSAIVCCHIYIYIYIWRNMEINAEISCRIQVHKSCIDFLHISLYWEIPSYNSSFHLLHDFHNSCIKSCIYSKNQSPMMYEMPI